MALLAGIAVALGVPVAHCLADANQHVRPEHHHQVLITVSGIAAPNPAAISAHPHAGTAIHAAWCSVMDLAAAISARADNPLRALWVVAVVLGAGVGAMWWSTHTGRGPPQRSHRITPRFGRILLTDLCIIRR
ncbi:hypothetical protein BAB78_02565 [Mycobacteroides abscessus]|uniref:Transmembrane protein n=1 Tax=Mycobacteroides abscessus 1948 TaxID=1299323 RepID=A0A829QP66_9MYCO|nr:hypothetical protein AOY11_02100 [Mycobacteroides abscessus]EIU40859.1 hypothetical protein MA6G0125R_4632 [Mycobacteroides abscessus 6G-0125-R]EIU51178.1 hypothetical protein MA6G0125S_0364 [Mycobacteroides abscessus 6G-0125-S]EIU61000.1 hypothetical protein MA6G0728S_0003 [Mycobacteroides abscessus 6G-0728-S]EIU74876.1 hypothetical protein MA6G1108_5246 [Mycobacteroides abscessus 6G-1108]EIV01318.1 hypothetical protein MA6G0212_0427 [Mycobacteroides abscessus 6G-0212]EIV02367.1 hypotheti